MKSAREKSEVLKKSLRAGFDYELVENLRPFVVKLLRYSKYAPLVKKLHSPIEALIGGYSS